MVVYACNPSYLSGKKGGLWLKASLGKKVNKMLSQKSRWNEELVAHACNTT
jgi:hypothetical protein